MQVLKDGVPDSKHFKPLALKEEALDFEFPPSCGMLHGGWDFFMRCIVNLKVDLFLFIRCIGIAQF